MPPRIRVTPETVRTDPSIAGLEVSAEEWQLDVARYREFLSVTTGISVAEGLSAAECYRVGNRLQALVETRKRHDEWGPELVAEYPDVESLETITWIARFFRACHECHDSAEDICQTPLDSDRSPPCR